MQLSPDYVHTIIGSADVSAEDAATIVRLAYIVAELDLEADVDESETLRSVTESLARYHPEDAEPIAWCGKDDCRHLRLRLPGQPERHGL